MVTHHDGPLLAVVAVELQQVFEREVTDDVWVQDEERLVVDVQKLSSQRQGAGWNQTHTHVHFSFLYNLVTFSRLNCVIWAQGDLGTWCKYILETGGGEQSTSRHMFFLPGWFEQD